MCLMKVAENQIIYKNGAKLTNPGYLYKKNKEY